MAQRQIAPPSEPHRCDLLFAGIGARTIGLYSPRTEVLGILRERLGLASRLGPRR
jgi:hypothetical protein